MKLNQRIFWISIVISVITLLVSVLLSFAVVKTEITEFINGILLNIFAGTIVLAITSLYEYAIEKRDLLENIMIQCVKMQTLFGKIKYFDDRRYVTFEQYSSYYKDKFKEEELILSYNDNKEKYDIEQKKKFEQIIDTYIEIADGDYNEFWKYYDELKFLFDFKDKEKHKLYYELFYYIYNDKIDKIREKAFHFKQYKEAKEGNYAVNKMFLVEIQKEIFYYEEQHYIDGNQMNFEISENEIDICSNEFDNMRKTCSLVGNKVTKHLSDIYDYIENIVYNKKERRDSKMKIKYINKKPEAKEYNRLTDSVGWGMRSEKIIKQALENTLYSLCAYDGGRLIGYGRIIGDKTIFLYIQDIMVIPEYQGKKIGTNIMVELLKKVEEYKKVNPNIRTYLGASKGKEDFYKKFGFVSRPNEELGAAMILKNDFK